MRNLAGTLLLLAASGCCTCSSWHRCERSRYDSRCTQHACTETPASTPTNTAPASPLKPAEEPLVPPNPSEARWRSPSRRSTAAGDDSTRQLAADLEKVKKEKSLLETKLVEETAKQTQQRLELEARLIVTQQQLQQANAVKQAQFQPPPTIHPGSNQFGGAGNFGGWSSTGHFGQAAWNPSGNWHSGANGFEPRTSSVEMWPFSPQR